jgi:hypothetical protein
MLGYFLRFLTSSPLALITTAPPPPPLFLNPYITVHLSDRGKCGSARLRAVGMQVANPWFWPGELTLQLPTLPQPAPQHPHRLHSYLCRHFPSRLLLCCHNSPSSCLSLSHSYRFPNFSQFQAKELFKIADFCNPKFMGTNFLFIPVG